MEWQFQNKSVRNANFSPALVFRVVRLGLSLPLPGSESNFQTVASLGSLVQHVRNMSVCIYTFLRASEMRACNNASQKKKEENKIKK